MNINAVDFNELRSNVSIIDLALQKGYKIIAKDGYKHPVLKNLELNDKIIIKNPKNPANQGYWSAYEDNDRGHIYHFIKNRLGTIFRVDTDSTKSMHHNILAIMVKYSGVVVFDAESSIIRSKIKDYEQQDFSLPVLDDLKNFEYLVGYRKLDKSIVRSHLFSNRIFTIRNHPYFSNTAYPYFNSTGSEIIGLEIKNKGYKKFLRGSDRYNCVWFSQLPKLLKNVYLFEAVEDALSYVELNIDDNAIDFLHSALFSFGGSLAEGQLNTLFSILKNHVGSFNNLNFYTCFDNDAAGNRMHEKLQTYSNTLKFNRILPGRKDFNEDLILLKNTQSII